MSIPVPTIMTKKPVATPSSAHAFNGFGRFLYCSPLLVGRDGVVECFVKKLASMAVEFLLLKAYGRIDQTGTPKYSLADDTWSR
jgi:hypothetical protein